MAKSPEAGYQPSPEEIKQAEDLMTEEQKKLSEAREGGYNAAMASQAEQEKFKPDERGRKSVAQIREEKAVDQVRQERLARLSDAMSEGLLTPEAFFKTFPDAKVAWFGKFGDVKKEIEDPSNKKQNHYLQFDHAFIATQLQADQFLTEIKSGLRYEGWDKYYICADEALARYLVENV